MRAITRMTGVHRTTVMKLLADLGRACTIYQDKTLRNLTCKRIQCDEVWSFVGAKQKNASPEMKAQGWGDIWTWGVHRRGHKTDSLLVYRHPRCRGRLPLYA